jgi:Tfp pilus assembly protein PilN
MIYINLLTPESIKKEERTEFLVIGYAVIGITLIVCGFNAGVKYRRLQAVQNNLSVATAELARYEDIVKQVEALEATKTVLETKKNVIDSLINGGLIYPRFLDDIIALLPRGISFKTLNAQMGADNTLAISIAAEAVSNYAIADFVTALSTSPDFSEVELGAISAQVSEKATISAFNITAKYLKKKS